MGYNTEFEGAFHIDKPVDDATYKLLQGLASTRRMKRQLTGYGTEGEFYVQADESAVIDSNEPPSTQPGLWCDWAIQPDKTTLQWNENEKFYYYVEWLQYIIQRILVPRGHSLSGRVTWTDDYGRAGVISVKHNQISVEQEVEVDVEKEEEEKED